MQVWGIGRNEYSLCEDEDGRERLWALCEVPECVNHVCVRMSERFCWVHTLTGGSTITKVKEDAYEGHQDTRCKAEVE